MMLMICCSEKAEANQNASGASLRGAARGDARQEKPCREWEGRSAALQSGCTKTHVPYLLYLTPYSGHPQRDRKSKRSPGQNPA